MNSSNKAPVISEALHYVKQFSGKLMLIKIGGSLLEDPELVKQLCSDLSLLRAVGIKLVLVHGGGKAINNTLEKHKIKSTFVAGLRVTTPDIMDVVEMVLCGKVNKMLVRTLNGMDFNVAGLSGVDDKLFFCKQYSPDHELVGEITKINTHFIQSLINSQVYEKGLVPIIAPVGIDSKGQAMNINADWAASKLAIALNVSKLIYLTDEDGINDKKGKLVSTIAQNQLSDFIADGTVTDGMLTKVKAIMGALNSGLSEVHILGGKTKHSLIQELFTNEGVGTICQQNYKEGVEDEVKAELSVIGC